MRLQELRVLPSVLPEQRFNFAPRMKSFSAVLDAFSPRVDSLTRRTFGASVVQMSVSAGRDSFAWNSESHVYVNRSVPFQLLPLMTPRVQTQQVNRLKLCLKCVFLQVLLI
uniref:(northern house mosquito) hypothetical protein n=1 Tax=Culex pipiens TaxID=7175 RepID=A0A8D8PGG3_CULPI